MIRARLRKIVKWNALGAMVLLVTCSLACNWYYWMWRGPQTAFVVAFDRGAFQIRYYAPQANTSKTGFALKRIGSDSWYCRIDAYGFKRWAAAPIRHDAAVPLWIPLLLSATAFAVAWRSERVLPARNNCCKKCGYHRAGLKPLAACPECGTDGIDASLPAESP